MNLLLLYACVIPWISQDFAKQPVLIDALLRNSLPKVEAALKAKADPNVREILVTKPSIQGSDPGGKRYLGRTALQIAVDNESLAQVKVLLAYKANYA